MVVMNLEECLLEHDYYSIHNDTWNFMKLATILKVNLLTSNYGYEEKFIRILE